MDVRVVDPAPVLPARPGGVRERVRSLLGGSADQARMSGGGMIRAKSGKHGSRGQASVETVIAAATILMFLPGIVAMFRYAEIQQWLDQVGRYVAWERSVWSDRDEEPWNAEDGVDEADLTITRTDSEIARHALLRVGENRRQLMLDGTDGEAQALVESEFEVPEFVNWSDAKKSASDPSMFAAQVRPDATFARQEMTEPDRWTVMDPLATRGEMINLGALNETMNLQLSDQNLAAVTIRVQVKNLFSPGRIDANPLDGEEMMGGDPLGEELGATMTMSTTTALQTNPWSPKNEDVFQKKVHNLDALGLVKVAAGMASLGMAAGANYAVGEAPLDDTGKQAVDRWSNFAPFVGQINAMWPSLDQNSADIPFNRVRLYDYDDFPGLNGPMDVYGNYDPIVAE
ncbi:MAG: hypothetical protein U5K73_04340 [Halofilum sp. (in: g-proteobacteria)]|nr:hypothetical protein [Halofilum sp. (in: g-proteobacteria)]